MLVADDVAFFSREISFLFFFSFLRFLLHAKFGPLCMKVLPPKLGLLLRDRETTDGKPARSRRVSFLEQREKKGEYRDVENWKCRNGTERTNERGNEEAGKWNFRVEAHFEEIWPECSSMLGRDLPHNTIQGNRIPPEERFSPFRRLNGNLLFPFRSQRRGEKA